MSGRGLCALVAVLGVVSARAPAMAGIRREKIAEYVQRQVEPFLDQAIDAGKPAAQQRAQMHSRMVLSVHSYTAALDGMADALVDPDVAVWIEHSLMAEIVACGGLLWDSQYSTTVSSKARDLAARFKGLTNARCRQLLDRRHRVMASGAQFAHALAAYVVGKMSSIRVVRLKLGGATGEFKNAILEARGQIDRLSVDPRRLQGDARVILDCRGDPIDSRIMALALVREFSTELIQDGELDWVDLYEIQSVPDEPSIYDAMSNPSALRDVLPQVEEMWRSVARGSADGTWSMDAASCGPFLWNAGLWQEPTLTHVFAGAARNEQPLYVVFENDAATWQVLSQVPIALDSETSGGGVTDGPDGPIVTVRPAPGGIPGADCARGRTLRCPSQGSRYSVCFAYKRLSARATCTRRRTRSSLASGQTINGNPHPKIRWLTKAPIAQNDGLG